MGLYIVGFLSCSAMLVFYAAAFHHLAVYVTNMRMVTDRLRLSSVLPVPIASTGRGENGSPPPGSRP
jgi:hypothetical protein